MIERHRKNPRERYKTISEEDKNKRQKITEKDIKVLLRKKKKKASILYYRERNKIFMKNKSKSKD